MVSISETIEIAAPAISVWEWVGDFHYPRRWTLGIDEQSSSLDTAGAIRRLRIGNAELVERLERHDPDALTLRYRMLAGPLPVSEYTSTLRVRALGPQHCRVEWSALCEARDIAEPKLQALLERAYRRNLIHLASLVAEFDRDKQTAHE
jgi:hypothetical protein